jgi:predicted transcriptional regulator
MENQDLSDVTDRLKEIIHHSQLKHGAFAAKIGVQNSTLTHIILGRNTPSLTVIQKVLLAFPEINADYLLIGKGELIKSNHVSNR